MTLVAQTWQLRLILAISLYLALIQLYGATLSGHLFWDLNVYRSAAQMYQLGQDAYAVGHPDLRFVYSPLVLWAFAQLGDSLVMIFTALYLACIAAFLCLAPLSMSLSALLAFGVMLNMQPLTIAFMTGNITIYMHLLILLIWLHRARPTANAFLLGAITITALIKPNFAAYFALWFLSIGRWDHNSTKAAIALIAVVAIWLLQALLQPAEFQAFLASLKEQTGITSAGQDMGYGFFTYTQRYGGSARIGLLLHLGICLALALFWLRSILPSLKSTKSHSALILISTGPMLICLLSNPRLKEYDLALVCILAIQAAYLLARHRPQWFLHPIVIVTLFVSTVHLLPVFNYPSRFTANAIILLTMLSSFLVSARMISRDSAQDPLRTRPATALH